MAIIVVLDCGATNVRAIAVNQKGSILASHYIKNETLKTNDSYHVWDFQTIWHKLITCCQNVTSRVKYNEIVGIAVTTFGVDGAPFDADGNQIYPIISWKCSRTVPMMEKFLNEFDRESLYLKNGVGDYSVNTIYKLMWLKENEPDVYSNMDKFVFISSMINQKLCGKLSTDRTMAGTSMLTDLDSSDWNEELLNYLNLSKESFPEMVDAGDVIGTVLDEVSKQLHLPAEIPVISAGHDTQFALFGSCIQKNQPFLSSGTWEILMSRTDRPVLNNELLNLGLTTELDSKKGVYNPAVQYISSAVMEWIEKTYFYDLINNTDKYSVMVKEGTKSPAGSNGVVFGPEFSVNADGKASGYIKNLSLDTTRGDIYRAALEGLAFKLKESLSVLMNASSLEANYLIVVGGGSKNTLWNQIRADILGIPVHAVSQSESTVIGAAMYGFFGAGLFNTPEEAQQIMKPGYTIYKPQSTYADFLKERCHVKRYSSSN